MQIFKKTGWVLTLLMSLFASLAQAAELKLKNGTELLIEQDLRSPRNFVMISFRGGNGLIKPKEQGVSQVLSLMLSEGPEGMSGSEYRKKLFLLAGEIHYSVSSRLATVSVLAPTDKLDEVLALALETLKKPKFDDATYQLARLRVEAGLAQREDDMRSTLRYVALRDAFAYHPDVRDGSPSRLSLKNIDIKTVKAAKPILFDPRYLLAAAVGPVDSTVLHKLIEDKLSSSGFLLKDLAQRKFESPRANQKPKGPEKIVLVDRPGATDNQVLYIVRRKIPLDNQEMIALELANTLLGGGMQGSLFKVLREERGLTYGAGSSVREDLGYWGVSSFASTDKLGALMSGVEEVVKAQAKLVVDQPTTELVKVDLLTQWKAGRELPSDRLTDTLSSKIYGRDLKFLETMDEWIAKTPASEVTKMGKEYFDLGQAYVYVMGDKQKLAPVFKSLGYKDKDVRTVEAASFL